MAELMAKHLSGASELADMYSKLQEDLAATRSDAWRSEALGELESMKFALERSSLSGGAGGGETAEADGSFLTAVPTTTRGAGAPLVEEPWTEEEDLDLEGEMETVRKQLEEARKTRDEMLAQRTRLQEEIEMFTAETLDEAEMLELEQEQELLAIQKEIEKAHTMASELGEEQSDAVKHLAVLAEKASVGVKDEA